MLIKVTDSDWIKQIQSVLCKPLAGCIYLGTIYVHDPMSTIVQCRQQRAGDTLQKGICWKLKLQTLNIANFQKIILTSACLNIRYVK